ncbi:hypothetical protein [uncultured Chryseobacterium sp.]|uniref:hypothetical protein n=1 Tax=uncultured Chryseobacterium sp. TaxID=259322 RepID=UPI0025E36697|nr:hypothetical protein [uncultured Chryseobacterium sp.]
MPNLIKKLLLLLEIGNHQFDSILWRTKPEKRKTLINHILKSKIPVGKNEREICELFGNEYSIYTSGSWSYSIEKDRFGNTLSALLLHFENGIVKSIGLKIKK